VKGNDGPVVKTLSLKKQPCNTNLNNLAEEKEFQRKENGPLIPKPQRQEGCRKEVVQFIGRGNYFFCRSFRQLEW